VATAVVAMPTHEMIRQNAPFARNFALMPEEEDAGLSQRMAGANKDGPRFEIPRPPGLLEPANDYEFNWLSFLPTAPGPKLM